jgi:hypothetical protein
MSDTYYSLKCPVCRTHNFQCVETLPVNYALLELADKTDGQEICEQHKLEIVGFCSDDEALLCGACIFEHKNHASFLLTSPEASAWADSKKKAFEDKEGSLKLMQGNWEKANKSLKRHISNLNSDAKVHIETLKRTEAKIIDSIKQGTKACLRQIKEISEHKQLESRQNKFTDRLKKFQAEIGRLSRLRQTFEQATVIDKLRSLSLPELEEDPPSVKDCMAMMRQLNLEVDYETAIKSGKFPTRRADA